MLRVPIIMRAGKVVDVRVLVDPNHGCAGTAVLNLLCRCSLRLREGRHSSQKSAPEPERRTVAKGRGSPQEQEQVRRSGRALAEIEAEDEPDILARHCFKNWWPGRSAGGA